MIYLIKDYQQLNKETVDLLLEKLPPNRKQKALRFTIESGKISCIISYLLFLYGFRRIYNQSGTPDFHGAPDEKPYLNDYPDIHFNLSHCAMGCVCIIDNSPVGIDIQEVRKVSFRNLEKLFAPNEVNAITESANPQKEFCRIWSMKEAISKLTGDGIFRDIRKISTEDKYIHTEYIAPDMYMSYASYEEKEQTIMHVTIEELMSLE